MAKQTQKHRRELKPTLVITRSKGFDHSGKKEVREEIVRNSYDSSGRQKECTRYYFEEEVPRFFQSRQRFSGYKEVFNWSEDGRECNIKTRNLSIAGLVQGKPDIWKRHYDKDGEDIYVKGLVKERDLVGRISRMTWNENMDCAYDSQSRLVRVIRSNEKSGEPETIQQTEYHPDGSTRTTLTPCGKNLYLEIVLYLENGNLHRDSIMDKNICLRTIICPLTAHYVETQRSKIGKDKDDRDYHATLTQGWLEDIASGKRIKGTGFSEIKVEK
jgi:hypothetical protein